MNEEFKIIILDDFGKNSFPNKALVDIHGKPMIQYVYECAVASGATEIVVATDSSRVGMAVEDFGATVCMIADDAMSDSSRLAEVADKMGWGDETNIVKFPGDMPLMTGSNLAQASADLCSQNQADCTMLYSLMPREEAENTATIKLVIDSSDYVIYCSRALLPYQLSDAYPVLDYKCHTGISAYRAGMLRVYRHLAVTQLDQAENIDELKLLFNGMKIHAALANGLMGCQVITEHDVEKVKSQIAATR